VGLLSFEIPKKVRSTEEHNRINSSDSGIDGTYVPNMSEEDRRKWKARHVKGENERVEIRKGIGGVQLVIIVYKEKFKNGQIEPIKPEYDGENETYQEYFKKIDEYHEWYKGYHDDIKISMNVSLSISNAEFDELNQAILEAKEYMKGNEND
jgi:hypothetical protein